MKDELGSYAESRVGALDGPSPHGAFWSNPGLTLNPASNNALPQSLPRAPRGPVRPLPAARSRRTARLRRQPADEPRRRPPASNPPLPLQPPPRSSRAAAIQMSRRATTWPTRPQSENREHGRAVAGPPAGAGGRLQFSAARNALCYSCTPRRFPPHPDRADLAANHPPGRKAMSLATRTATAARAQRGLCSGARAIVGDEAGLCSAQRVWSEAQPLPVQPTEPQHHGTTPPYPTPTPNLLTCTATTPWKISWCAHNMGMPDALRCSCCCPRTCTWQCGSRWAKRPALGVFLDFCQQALTRTLSNLLDYYRPMNPDAKQPQDYSRDSCYERFSPGKRQRREKQTAAACCWAPAPAAPREAGGSSSAKGSEAQRTKTSPKHTGQIARMAQQWIASRLGK
jgi:hypothetical protein